MLSINMRIFKTVLLLLAVFCCDRIGQCSPIANETSVPAESQETHDATIDHYDQRQNGSENFRIHVDGVMLVVAPVEAFLLTGVANGNKPNLPIIDSSKLPPGKPEVNPKPSLAPKSAHSDIILTSSKRKRRIVVYGLVTRYGPQSVTSVRG
ncbi:hypothetical protein E2986_12336 [Frieseomelitta varia]|uniref:Uncharacterized protein n=1 Tax=Frieseomelitta varia TaxID=561572 RepID=A0A833S066_9HYME|nr:hypothetical protein E2986_12336 [Frieseomelitta varia]